MSAIHPIAAAGFGADAARYDAGRPGYPHDAFGRIADVLGLTAGTVVADIGAGTGKLTAPLKRTGATVVAVEPVAAMAAFLRTAVPGVPTLAASAEDLPFHDASLDAITSAQAFHWFDAERAWGEFRRVLRPGGGVALVWNARDRGVTWIDAVWSIMDEVEKRAPWRDHERPRLASGPGFAPLQREQFWHEVPVDRQTVLDRIASVSHVAVLPVKERRDVLDRVAAAVPDAAGLTMLYRVDLYLTRRV